ncbi:unnamed protein product [Ceratitis capitata]|uniref:(Mediterranean fruit fly) hypothetical protein n=1 Tax=Ceratitis capitata TaxID=7213 RepID=A0A811U7P1_CERCA|nr:unnamed protein product [Ceratitis capitata]
MKSLLVEDNNSKSSTSSQSPWLLHRIPLVPFCTHERKMNSRNMKELSQARRLVGVAKLKSNEPGSTHERVHGYSTRTFCCLLHPHAVSTATFWLGTHRNLANRGKRQKRQVENEDKEKVARYKMDSCMELSSALRPTSEQRLRRPQQLQQSSLQRVFVCVRVCVMKAPLPANQCQTDVAVIAASWLVERTNYGRLCFILWFCCYKKRKTHMNNATKQNTLKGSKMK